MSISFPSHLFCFSRILSKFYPQQSTEKVISSHSQNSTQFLRLIIQFRRKSTAEFSVASLGNRLKPKSYQNYFYGLFFPRSHQITLKVSQTGQKILFWKPKVLYQKQTARLRHETQKTLQSQTCYSMLLVYIKQSILSISIMNREGKLKIGRQKWKNGRQIL